MKGGRKKDHRHTQKGAYYSLLPYLEKVQLMSCGGSMLVLVFVMGVVVHGVSLVILFLVLGIIAFAKYIIKG